MGLSHKKRIKIKKGASRKLRQTVSRLHRYLGGAAGNEVTESFMVAGGAGGVAYSYDGITWIESKSGTSLFRSYCDKIAYNGSMWLACGEGTVGYSLDGINWTASEIKWTTSSGGMWRQFKTVATNGSIWLCGGWDHSEGETYGLIGYSSDGITWTVSESARSVFSPNGECLHIAWNGSIWLAAGYNNNNVIFAYSSDGITWTASNVSDEIFCSGIAWNGTMWVGGSLTTGNRLVYSYDGINWNGSANGNSLFTDQTGCMSVATNGSMWVAGNFTFQGGNSLLYSYDGINWTPSANGNSLFMDCMSVAWNGTRWVACGLEKPSLFVYRGVIAYSTDGITWTRGADPLVPQMWTALASRHVLPYTVPLCKRVTGTNSCVIEDTKYRILE